jgi:hypothetical protein
MQASVFDRGELPLEFDRWHPRNCECRDCEAELIREGSKPVMLSPEGRIRVRAMLDREAAGDWTTGLL